ncbi:hypothetical protein [Candidatus Halocynthiibacter alkanivorans]|uniref:hypothetical protein n=1 Tax=Candidatus Halocynthiibacter alkanivorans TaxID=2267619 RepID=UPI00109D0E8C|nr:hypothetical protein [Candidatus Halocynthiibacter alkanivorans]
MDAIVEGENLGGVLEDLAKQFARAALEAALFGSGPFSSGAGGGGGLLAGIVGAVFGKRANGGPVRAGESYLVNENTPNSEVFVPSTSGAILNVPLYFSPVINAPGADQAAVDRIEATQNQMATNFKKSGDPHRPDW